MPASASVRRGRGIPGPLARAGVAVATWLIARLLPRHRPGRDRGGMLTGPNLEHRPRADKRLILSLRSLPGRARHGERGGVAGAARAGAVGGGIEARLGASSVAGS